MTILRKLSKNQTNYTAIVNLQKPHPMFNDLPHSKIVIRNNDGLYFLKVSEIVRLQGDGNYSHFYLSSGEHYISSKGLSEYEPLLPHPLFYRIHQSHIICLNWVRHWNRKDGTLILLDGTELPLARRKQEEVLKLLTGGI